MVQAERKKGRGSGNGGATWCHSAVGPGPDSRAVSRPRCARAARSVRAGEGAGVESLVHEAGPAARERGA
jgi:hypothetical protein